MLKSYQNDSTKIVRLVALTVVALAVIIAMAILWNHRQKLDACNKMIDNAARIICISDQ